MSNTTTYEKQLSLQTDILYCLEGYFKRLIDTLDCRKKSKVTAEELSTLCISLLPIKEEAEELIEIYADMFDAFTIEDIDLIAASKNKTILEVKDEISKIMSGYNRNSLKGGLIIGLDHCHRKSNVHIHAKKILEKLDKLLYETYRVYIEVSGGIKSEKDQERIMGGYCMLVNDSYLEDHGNTYDNSDYWL